MTTAEELLKVEQYWEEQKQRIMLLAKQAGHEEFEPSRQVVAELVTTFNLNGNGPAERTDEEILEELVYYLD